jgi:hypothetical protein
VDRLQAVAHIGQGARHDHAHRVIEVARLHLVDDVDALELAPFIPVYVAAKAGFDAAAKRQDVLDAQAAVKTAEATYRSASGKKARDEARAKYDASVAALGTLLQPEKDMLEKTFAVATTPDDKFIAGQLALNLGQLAADKAMQRRGLQSMVDSGKLSPADAAKFQFYIGGLSFDLKEYAAARTAFQASIAGGYTEGGVDGLLADTYFNDNMPNEGLKVLDEAIAKRGAAAPEDWMPQGDCRRLQGANCQPKRCQAFRPSWFRAYPSTGKLGAVALGRPRSSASSSIRSRSICCA